MKRDRWPSAQGSLDRSAYLTPLPQRKDMLHLQARSKELERELIHTHMIQKPMLRVEVCTRALRASQKRKKEMRRLYLGCSMEMFMKYRATYKVSRCCYSNDEALWDLSRKAAVSSVSSSAIASFEKMASYFLLMSGIQFNR